MSIDWPFQQPTNRVAFTTENILSGEKPILRVVHSLEDSSWQFLPNYDLENAIPKVISLSSAVKIDPSVQELYDLPLAWEAIRLSGDKPWIKKPAYPTDFEDLILVAMDYLQDCQDNLREAYDLNKWERWDYDQEEATLTFSNQGEIGLITEIQFVGSVSEASLTWLWSWDNSYLLDKVTDRLSFFPQFGEENNFEKMKQAKWPADEYDGWEMTAITCYLLDALGAYKVPSASGPLFMVITEIKEDRR